MNPLSKTSLGLSLVAIIIAGFFIQETKHLEQAITRFGEQQQRLSAHIEELLRKTSILGKGETTPALERAQGGQSSELDRLRARVAQASNSQDSQDTKTAQVDPFMDSVLRLVSKAAELNQKLEQMPEKKIPELKWLRENDWLEVAGDVDRIGTPTALKRLRNLGKSRLYPEWQKAFSSYLERNNGQLPENLSQLKPYFGTPIDDSILQRYELLHGGNVRDFDPKEFLIKEKSPVDPGNDDCYRVGINRSSFDRY